MKSNLSRGLQSLVIVLGLLIQQGVSVPTPFDLAFVKNGVELGESECSANTLIDISFSSSSILSCTTSACSVVANDLFRPIQVRTRLVIWMLSTIMLPIL